MHKSIEVYLGDLVQIPCWYIFTDANNEPVDPNIVITQWFVVSTAGPAVKTDAACLELSVAAWYGVRIQSGAQFQDVHFCPKKKNLHKWINKSSKIHEIAQMNCRIKITLNGLFFIDFI